MAFDELKVEGEENTQCVVYVRHIGTEIDGSNIYHMYLSAKPDEVFAEGWGDIPACTVPRKLMDLDEDMYEHVAEVKSDITLDLAQNCCCFSMQDSRDGIVALAYENLDNAEEYPEPRIIIHFGDDIESVEKMLSKRDIFLKYIE
jgi:hypothetical protein